MSEIITLHEPHHIEDYVACARVGKEVRDSNGERKVVGTNVWFAQDKNGRNVVLKKAQKVQRGDSHDLGEKLLLHEFDLHRKLEHPHICQALDYVLHDDQGYLVTKRIGSEDLDAFLERTEDALDRIFPKPKKVDSGNGKIIVTIMADIADAAAYCHKEGILHLDIKPQNIAVCEKRGYLFDFGAAMKHPGEHPLLKDGVIGTSEFMAPEHRDGMPKPSSDIFSLGVVTHVALIGKHPYRLKFNKNAPAEIDYDTPEFNEQQLAYLNGAGKWIARALLPNWEKRPTDAEELKYELKELTSKHHQKPSAKTSELCPASLE